MNAETAAAPTPEVSERVMELCRRFLKSLGQTVKLVSLYSAGHPVPASSQQESWQLLHEIFAESGWPEVSIALVAGRWLVNGRVAADSAHAYELLALSFRAHALTSAEFRPECRLYELSALCELAATPPNRAYETDAEDFLKQRGVRHVSVNLENFVRARRVASTAACPMVTAPPPPPSPAPAKTPLPPPAAAAGPAAPGAPPSAEPTRGLGFGSFIKGLVEKAVADPGERAQIYAEAVRHVEQALARHVSEATHKLLLEKQGVVNERVRAESVFSTVAHGKMVVDQEGRVLMMDPAAEQIVGQPFTAVAGKKLMDGLPGRDQFVALSKELILPENRPVSEEVATSGEAAVADAFRQSVAVVHDERGRVVGTYAVLPHAAKYRETQRLQEEFLANVTHDLKAPLSSICSALEVLTEKLAPRLEGEEADFLDICVRNSRTLRQMIDELLDFSKIQSGRMSVHPERCRIEPLLEECARALTPWARSKRVALELAPAAGPLPAVLADRRRILQVLGNLVSNAIKFTPEGGRVTLRAEHDAERERVAVGVQDTGCGIPEDQQGRIYERFVQGAGAPREGVGLGLTIVRELVQQHRGELSLESAPGKGSTFSFTLPTAAAS